MYKNQLKRIVSVMIAVMMIFSLKIAAFADEMPDLSKTGSIKVTMTDPDTKAAVPGGSLTMYQVGTVIVEDGFRFAFTDEFAPSGLSLEDIQSKELAEQLNEFASAHDLKGEKKTIGSDGTVEFTDKELGLYLFVQIEKASGYSVISSFLATLPAKSGEGENISWIYEVDASPKVELEKEPTPTPTPTPPGLPQTGQLNWPIPVLAIVGLAFFVIGWSLRYRERKSKNA